MEKTEILKLEMEQVNDMAFFTTSVFSTDAELNIYRGMTCALQNQDVFMGTLAAIVRFSKDKGLVDLLHKTIDELAASLSNDGSYEKIYDSRFDKGTLSEKIHSENFS